MQDDGPLRREWCYDFWRTQSPLDHCPCGCNADFAACPACCWPLTGLGRSVLSTSGRRPDKACVKRPKRVLLLPGGGVSTQFCAIIAPAGHIRTAPCRTHQDNSAADSAMADLGADGHSRHGSTTSLKSSTSVRSEDGLLDQALNPSASGVWVSHMAQHRWAKPCTVLL